MVSLALGSLVALSARGQTNYTGAYYFNTVAGAAIGADGTGKLALFNRPNSTAMDSAGNVYVADYNDHTVRKITPAGVVTTLAGFAGDGEVGDRDGTGVPRDPITAFKWLTLAAANGHDPARRALAELKFTPEQEPQIAKLKSDALRESTREAWLRELKK